MKVPWCLCDLMRMLIVISIYLCKRKRIHCLCPVGLGCRIHRQHLCRGERLLNEFPGYDVKQSDGKVLAILGLWGMWSTPSLPPLPGMVVSDIVISIAQIELNCLHMLNWITWKRTVLRFKQSTYAKVNIWNRTLLTFNCVKKIWY